MKLYVNVVPFRFYDDDEFIEIGSTFAAVGANPSGVNLRLVKNAAKPNTEDGDFLVMPEVLSHAFKPVDELPE